MEKWFNVCRYPSCESKYIVKIDVVYATKGYVYLLDHNSCSYRTKKEGEYNNYFPSFKEAKDFAINRSKDKIELLEDQLKSEKEELQKIESENEENL